jgi:hypothetical protein
MSPLDRIQLSLAFHDIMVPTGAGERRGYAVRREAAAPRTSELRIDASLLDGSFNRMRETKLAVPKRRGKTKVA